MIVRISAQAEEDLSEGYWFYEKQADGLGDYFRDSMIVDIDSLVFYAGIHEVAYGYHRMLTRRFPFTIYYEVVGETATVVAVLDARKDPAWTSERLS